MRSEGDEGREQIEGVLVVQSMWGTGVSLEVH